MDTSAAKNSDLERTSVEPTDQSQYQKITDASLYLSTHSMRNISADVSLLCRSSADTKKDDLIAAKRVLRYLSETLTLHSAYTKVTQSFCAMQTAAWLETAAIGSLHQGLCLNVSIQPFCEKL